MLCRFCLVQSLTTSGSSLRNNLITDFISEGDVANGAEGIKIRVSGRLGGSEIARTEIVRSGTIPLHTLRKNIDYGFAEADTLAGKIGIKCWICKKDEKTSFELRQAGPATA